MEHSRRALWSTRLSVPAAALIITLELISGPDGLLRSMFVSRGTAEEVALDQEGSWVPRAGTARDIWFAAGSADEPKAWAIREEFRWSWDACEWPRNAHPPPALLKPASLLSDERHAFGKDELLPLSRSASTKFAGLGLTLVDSLDALWLLNFTDEFGRAERWVDAELRFTRNTEIPLSVAVRVLGGLLSAHALSGRALFARRAAELGERLLAALPPGAPVPLAEVSLGRRRARSAGSVSLSEAAALQLEFRELSRVTRDARFAAAVGAVAEHLASLAARATPAHLLPVLLDRRRGTPHRKAATSLGSRANVHYETLLKLWLQVRSRSISQDLDPARAAAAAELMALLPTAASTTAASACCCGRRGAV